MLVRIRLNSDYEIVKAVKEALDANDGYCPCKIEHLPENECMCKDFRNQKDGECHCGLFIKFLEEEQ